MSQLPCKVNSGRVQYLTPDGGISQWFHFCTLILFLGANYCNHLFMEGMFFTDQSGLRFYLCFSPHYKVNKGMYVQPMPKFQWKVQILHDLHSLPETFAPCAPKGLAPNAHTFLQRITPAHIQWLQGEMIFQWQSVCQNSSGFFREFASSFDLAESRLVTILSALLKSKGE